MYGLTRGATTIYIFTNSKKHFTATNQQNTRNATLRHCDVTADTLPKSGENYRKRLLGKENSPMIVNTLVDNGWNEGNG
jgi:hypothetical protein